MVHGENPLEILQAALASLDSPFSLKPKAAQLLLDYEYILYACGLLRTVAPDVALEIGLKYLKPLSEHSGEMNGTPNQERHYETHT